MSHAETPASESTPSLQAFIYLFLHSELNRYVNHNPNTDALVSQSFCNQLNFTTNICLLCVDQLMLLDIIYYIIFLTHLHPPLFFNLVQNSIEDSAFINMIQLKTFSWIKSQVIEFLLKSL